MEQTTLQQRIEERAKNKLLKDLYDANNKEASIENMFNIYDKHKPNIDRLWDRKLDVREHYSSYGNPKTTIIIGNDYSQKVFDTLLPKYIIEITDEILQKIDEIDYLLENKKEEVDY